MADIAGLTLPGWGAQFVASRSGYPGYVIGTTPDSAATAVWGKWFGLTSVPRGHAVIGLGLDITAVAGGPPRGHAVIGLGLDGAAVGERQALGSAEIGLGIDVEARTGIAPTGYAVIGLGLDGYGVGDAAPGGSVSLDLGIGITAVGYRPPMGISIDFGGDLPITVLGHAVSGWHRPDIRRRCHRLGQCRACWVGHFLGYAAGRQRRHAPHHRAAHRDDQRSHHHG